MCQRLVQDISRVLGSIETFARKDHFARFRVSKRNAHKGSSAQIAVCQSRILANLTRPGRPIVSTKVLPSPEVVQMAHFALLLTSPSFQRLLVRNRALIRRVCAHPFLVKRVSTALSGEQVLRKPNKM